MRDFSDHPAVDWSAYASRYDMLLHHNPAYIDLLTRFDRWVDAHAPTGPIQAVDVGAGTGSFAERLLARREDATLTLVEPDPAMRAHATSKLARFGARAEVVEGGFESPLPQRYDVVISTHAIYTADDPRAALRKLAELANPNGVGFLVDFGGRMRVWSWRLYLLTHLLRHRGLIETVRLAREGREVAQQNARVAKMQRAGRYWLHDHDAFVDEVQAAGWSVLVSATVYRGCSTLVVVERAA